MINLFLNELESKTVPFKNYKNHNGTLFKYSIIQPNVIYFEEYISLDPLNANLSAKFICNLADKYKITITGKVNPFFVGPTLTNSNMFFKGMHLKRLMKWYKHYGFVVNENYEIIRIPK